MCWRSPRGRPENIRWTSWINFPGTSLGHQIKTSLGCQIETSPGWSNRNFRGRPGDFGGGHPRRVLWTNICRLGRSFETCVLVNDRFCGKLFSSLEWTTKLDESFDVLDDFAFKVLYCVILYWYYFKVK